MAISTIRSYTEEDKARVEAAAERFCKRHGIKFGEESAETMIEYEIEINGRQGDAANLRKLWTACYCRALQVPCDVRTTTGYGYIGRRCA